MFVVGQNSINNSVELELEVVMKRHGLILRDVRNRINSSTPLMKWVERKREREEERTRERRSQEAVEPGSGGGGCPL